MNLLVSTYSMNAPTVAKGVLFGVLPAQGRLGPVRIILHTNRLITAYSDATLARTSGGTPAAAVHVPVVPTVQPVADP